MLPTREERIVLPIRVNQNNTASHTMLCIRKIRRVRRCASSRAHRHQPLHFLAVQARKLSPPGSLGWAERALERRVRRIDCDEAIDVLSENSCFWLDGSIFGAAWPAELV